MGGNLFARLHNRDAEPAQPTPATEAGLDPTSPAAEPPATDRDDGDGALSLAGDERDLA